MREWIRKARQRVSGKTFFHLHMISDSTGGTLKTIGRAVAAQYSGWRAIEHLTPMVREEAQLDAALDAVDREPGIVLYTIVDEKLSARLHQRCRTLGLPAVDVLTPLTQVFDTHLGERMSGRAGAQHELDEDYFGRLDAVRFAMMHDDGNLPEDIEAIDILLVGISRTSKTPTSIHLAQQGLRVANYPLVPGVPLPQSLLESHTPLIVGLVASVERILQVRETRLQAFDRQSSGDDYIDRASIQQELAWTRKLCRDHNWPIIDVSRKSVEETAAEILALR